VLDVSVRRASARRRGRLHILTAHVEDATGEIRATWFNQPWLEAKLVPGTRLRLRGKPNRFGFQVSSYDIGDAVETADLAPVYPSTADLAQKTLRAVTEAALPLARAGGEPLPTSVRVAETLPLRADAVVGLHRPRTADEAEASRRRLALDELLTLQLALRRRAAERATRRSRRSLRSTPTSAGRRRCSGSCRATSARARPRSRCTPSSARSRPGARER